MKKFIFGAVALLAAATFTGCDKCASSESCQAADSLSIAYGDYVGTMVLADFSNMENSTRQDKEDFLHGMQLVLGANPDRNTQIGMQVALQLSNELAQMKEAGIEIDETKAFNSLKAAFLADSLDYAKMQSIGHTFRLMYEKAMTEAKAKKDAERAQEPQAIQNEKVGKQFIADQQAENPEVKVTESGLGYLIQVPGEGDKPSETSTVEVNYTGKLIDGTVFDTTEGRGTASFNLQGVVPGFREGIMLLGKGGKATLYIPGNLAYGVNGQPQAGIGPNQLLIFDVEVLDIK